MIIFLDIFMLEIEVLGFFLCIKMYVFYIVVGIVFLVFLDSLWFKFINVFEMQMIFGKLNDWVVSFGVDGLFV